MTKPAFQVDQADAVTWLNGIESESVDLAVTDPAYESLEKHRAIGTTTRLTKDWFPIFPNARYVDLLRELYRVLKQDTHCYVYCDQETMFVIKPIAEAAGFTFWKPIVWDKVCIGMGYHYRARYEFVLFFEKGKRRLNDLGQSDIISARRIRNGYPTEKPSEVSKVLIEQSSERGELVIDPFLGSGSALAAALNCGRNAAGCDIQPGAVAGAEFRLAGLGEPAQVVQARAQGRLFA